MSARLRCGCPGTVYGGAGPDRPTDCEDDATQEDFLCDRCRVFRCPTVVTHDDWLEAHKRCDDAFGPAPVPF